MHQPRAAFTLYSLARLMLRSDVSALTRAHSGVYIADLPGKAAGDCRTKRVTTGKAEIETHKTSFSKSRRLRIPRSSFKPDISPRGQTTNEPLRLSASGDHCNTWRIK
jgi:hypothetical protein